VNLHTAVLLKSFPSTTLTVPGERSAYLSYTDGLCGSVLSKSFGCSVSGREERGTDGLCVGFFSSPLSSTPKSLLHLSVPVPFVCLCTTREVGMMATQTEAVHHRQITREEESCGNSPHTEPPPVTQPATDRPRPKPELGYLPQRTQPLSFRVEPHSFAA